jgi:putative hemolysin
LTPIGDLKDAVGIRNLPDEDSGDFHTLGGFIMTLMKRVPKAGDTLNVKGWSFTVIAMDGHRVERVKIIRAFEGTEP